MTIRLLCAHDKYPANAIVTLDAGTEAGLIAVKRATATLTGGDTFFTVVQPAQQAQPLVGGGRASLKAAEQVVMVLPEGQALSIVGAASTSATAQQMNADGAVVQSWSIGAGAAPQIGPFSGTQKILISCTAGGVDATVGGAVLSSLQSQPGASGVISTPAGVNVPAWWKSRTASLMVIGDSLSAQGFNTTPITPPYAATRNLNQVFTNINSGGLFIVLNETNNAFPTGNFTVRYYAATKSLTVQAQGDTEGPQVPVPTSGFFSIPSGNPAYVLYVGLVGRVRPLVDKADTINNTGILRRDGYSGTYGPVPWVQTLTGNVYTQILNYAIPTIRASDWLEAASQWNGIYTDVSRIALGTNDISDRASALQALVDVEKILQMRLAIGSKCILVALTPYNSRSTAVTQAVTEFNLGLRAMASRNNIDIVDAWPYLADPNGTGGYVTGMSSDGLHFSNLGGYLMAARCEAQIHKKWMPPADAAPFNNALYDAVLAPYGNLLTNPNLTGVSGSKGTGVTGEVPTNWTVSRDGASANITATCLAPASAGAVSRTDRKQGKYATMTISNATGIDGEAIRFRPASFITANYAPGDLLVYEGEIRIQGSGIMYVIIEHTLDNTTSGASYSAGCAVSTALAAALLSLDGDTVSIPFKSAPIRVDAGVSRMIPGISIGLKAGGSAVLDVGQSQYLHKVAP